MKTMLTIQREMLHFRSLRYEVDYFMVSTTFPSLIEWIANVKAFFCTYPIYLSLPFNVIVIEKNLSKIKGNKLLNIFGYE